MRFERQFERLIRAGVLARLCLSREQHGTTAPRHAAIDQTIAAADSERLERALPVAGMALQVEQRFHRPAELGVECYRALGELPRGLRLTFALRFEKQAAQAELLRIARCQHRLEDAAGGGAVSRQLGGLRAQQM